MAKVSEENFNKFNQLQAMYERLSKLNISLKKQTADTAKLETINQMHDLITSINDVNVAPAGFSSTSKQQINKIFLFAENRKVAITQLAEEIASAQAAALLEITAPTVEPVVEIPAVSTPIAVDTISQEDKKKKQQVLTKILNKALSDASRIKSALNSGAQVNRSQLIEQLGKQVDVMTSSMAKAAELGITLKPAHGKGKFKASMEAFNGLLSSAMATAIARAMPSADKAIADEKVVPPVMNSNATYQSSVLVEDVDSDDEEAIESNETHLASPLLIKNVAHNIAPEPVVETQPIVKSPVVPVAVKTTVRPTGDVFLEDVDSDSDDENVAPLANNGELPKVSPKTVRFDLKEESPASTANIFRTLSAEPVSTSTEHGKVEQSSAKSQVMPTPAQTKSSPIIAALNKEVTRLNKLSHNTGVTGFFWNSTYQAKLRKVEYAIDTLTGLKGFTEASVKTEMENKNSSLYKALNTHTSTFFQFSSGDYGMPCSWKTRSVLNIEKVISEVDNAATASANEGLLFVDAETDTPENGRTLDI